MRDIITPDPAEYVAWLLAEGHTEEAADLQGAQIKQGRAAALADRRFDMRQPAAWQTGYVEALGDNERGPYAYHWSDQHCAGEIR